MAKVFHLYFEFLWSDINYNLSIIKNVVKYTKKIDNNRTHFLNTWFVFAKLAIN